MKEKNIENMKQNKKLSKGKIILLSTISVIIIIILIGIIWYFNSPAIKFMGFVADDDPVSAVELYNNYSSYNSLDKWLIDEQANKLIDECIEICEEENISVGEVSTILSYLSNTPNEEISEKAMNNFNYYSGKYDYESGNYSGAVYYYTKLEGTEFMTEEVEKQLEESKKEYKEEILTLPDFKGSKEDYYDLLTMIDEAYYLLDEDEEIKEKKEEVQREYTTYEADQMEEQIKDLENEEKYEDALNVVLYNSYVLEEDGRYERLYEETTESYINYIQDKVDKLVKEGKKEEAISVIDSAIEILPEEVDTFIKMKDEIN